jgi:hypothetical protein
MVAVAVGLMVLEALQAVLEAQWAVQEHLVKVMLEAIQEAVEQVKLAAILVI